MKKTSTAVCFVAAIALEAVVCPQLGEAEASSRNGGEHSEAQKQLWRIVLGRKYSDTEMESRPAQAEKWRVLQNPLSPEAIREIANRICDGTMEFSDVEIFSGARRSSENEDAFYAMCADIVECIAQDSEKADVVLRRNLDAAQKVAYDGKYHDRTELPLSFWRIHVIPVP
jgi:hypothetical protein